MSTSTKNVLVGAAIASLVWYAIYQDFQFTDFHKGIAASGAIAILVIPVRKFTAEVWRRIDIVEEKLECFKRSDLSDRLDRIETKLKIQKPKHYDDND